MDKPEIIRGLRFEAMRLKALALLRPSVDYISRAKILDAAVALLEVDG